MCGCLRYEKAGYNFNSAHHTPLEIMMTCPDHQDFSCQNKVVKVLLIYCDHQEFID